MPYINPFTRDTREHVVEIISNEVPTPGGESVYKLKVKCSCQWEVLVRNEGEAENWKLAHLQRHPRETTEGG